MTLLEHLVGREGHSHVHKTEVPLHPCTAVEPQVALLAPVIVVCHLQRLEDSLHTCAVCAMWVGKVARSVDLVGSYLAQEVYDDVYICLCELTLLDTSSLVEWEVEEVCVGVGVESE